MVRVCCVCNNSRYEATLFRFPCNEKRVNLWLKFLPCANLENLPLEQYSKLFVCKNHFEKKFLKATLTSSRSRITQKAYPSLFTEIEIASGISTRKCAKSVDPLEEHRYVKKMHIDHNYFNQEMHDQFTSEDMTSASDENTSEVNNIEGNFSCAEETQDQHKGSTAMSQHLVCKSLDTAGENEYNVPNTDDNRPGVQLVINNSDPGHFEFGIENGMNDRVPSSMSESENHLIVRLNPLPEFDPGNKQLLIDDWINKVEEYAALYQWSEAQLLENALPKLTGLAKVWYDSLSSLDYNWSECKKGLMEQFPPYDNYAQLLRDMLETKVALKESLELYYYDKIKLLNRCDITGKRAVDCLLDGIEDKELLYRAQIACYSEPEDLLPFFKSVQAKDTNVQSKPEEVIRESSDTQSDLPQLNLPGGLDEKYVLPIVVDLKPMFCCVNLDNQNTLIRVTDFIELNVPCSTDDMPLLYGFGDSLVEPLGRAVVDIQIQTVKMSIEVFIVPDELLNYPVLLGRNFVEQAGVLMVNTDAQLWPGR